MASTAPIKLYRLKRNYDFERIEKRLIDEFEYEEFYFNELIQTANNVRIRAYKRRNREDPDWVKLIKKYLIDKKIFDDKLYYSAIIFIFIKDIDENRRIIADSEETAFLFTGGSGSHNILRDLNYQFGIEILEHIFNPNENKLDSVSEKAVVGDILASRRYYRRARALAFEDDFGKFFQGINLKISKSQIKEFFPSLSKFKKEKLKDIVSISCSDSLEIKMRIEFPVLMNLIKDILIILKAERERIFNQSLLPLTKRKDKPQIDELYIRLRNRVIRYLQEGRIIEMDIDICPQDYEEFFTSTRYEVSWGTFHYDSYASEVIPRLQGSDIGELNDPEFLNRIYELVLESREYRQSQYKIQLLKSVVDNVVVTTYDNEENVTTHGKLIDFIQVEFKTEETYFHLDNVWYLLKSKFNETLKDKYKTRVTPHVLQREFIKEWNGESEDEYNRLYDSGVNPLFLHTVNVDNVELSDALYLEDATLYIIHVKVGVGASIRDLVSQVHMSARIIEEEIRTNEFVFISALYDSAVGRKRIDSKTLSKEAFVDYFKNNREYCLAIYDNRIHQKRLADGDFGSTIAKFSLVEFSSMMHANDWQYSVVSIG